MNLAKYPGLKMARDLSFTWKGMNNRIDMVDSIKKRPFLDLVINNLQIPVELDRMDQYIKSASLMLGISAKDLKIVKLLSKELDLKNKEQFHYTISIVVRTLSSFDNKGKFPEYIERTRAVKKSTNNNPNNKKNIRELGGREILSRHKSYLFDNKR